MRKTFFGCVITFFFTFCVSIESFSQITKSDFEKLFFRQEISIESIDEVRILNYKTTEGVEVGHQYKYLTAYGGTDVSALESGLLLASKFRIRLVSYSSISSIKLMNINDEVTLDIVLN